MKEAFTFQSKQKVQIPQHECPSYHIAHFFILLEKDSITFTALQMRECQEGATAWRPSLAPLCLASSRGRGGTEVIKNTASPSVGARCVSGLLSLWRCRLVRLFHPMKWLEIKPKSDISMSVNYQQSHLSSPIRLASHRGLRNFHEAWTILTDARKKRKCDKIWTSLIKD